MNSIKSIIEQLKARTPLPPLYPNEIWKPQLSAQIQNLQVDAAVRAGLLLWNDDLEASHTISQGISNATGSFWHAVMHRREGDASNSKYWWRRTGAHPAFGAVQQTVLTVLEEEEEAEGTAQTFAEELRRAKTWLPERFVDVCTAGKRGDAWLLRVQAAEIETLLNWCLAHDKSDQSEKPL